MCGLAGMIFPRSNMFDSIGLQGFKELFKTSLARRGPDQFGVFHSDNDDVLLFQSRLIVNDFTNGTQPIKSKNGRYVLIFNGEIYNHKALRKNITWFSLETLSSDSDSEVLFELLIGLGIDNTLKLIEGVFFFFFFDTKKNQLVLFRDFLCEKPLFYHYRDNGLVFSSELDPIIKSLSNRPQIKNKSLYEFINNGYISAPNSIYSNIKKLMPGEYKIFKKFDSSIRLIDTIKFFSPIMNGEFLGSFEEAVVQLDSLINNTVQEFLDCDRNVGVYLSGGVDSSLIAFYANKIQKGSIDAFTAGFDDVLFDETKYAAKIANHIGCRHHVLKVNSVDILNFLESGRGISIYGEPFSDMSPLALLAEKVSKTHKVILSGDGADEMFGGYSGQQLARKLFKFKKLVDFIPNSIKSTLIRGLNSSSILSSIDALSFLLSTNIPAGKRLGQIGKALLADNKFDFYRGIRCLDIAQSIMPFMKINQQRVMEDTSISIEQAILLIDQSDYLPNDILVKADRTSMAVGLEARAPLLSQKIVKFANGLPCAYKMTDGQEKMVLKALLKGKFPDKLVNRPKMGFNLPIDNWIRGPLKPLVTDLLNDQYLSNSLFNEKSVKSILDAHFSGRFNYGQWISRLMIYRQWEINHA